MNKELSNIIYEEMIVEKLDLLYTREELKNRADYISNLIQPIIDRAIEKAYQKGYKDCLKDKIL